MEQHEKYFIRGFACCLANAISLEEWRYSQIGGGITIEQMIEAGVDKSEIKTIKNSKG
jgi:hypothetical protein